jgi:hypothetical protein
MNAHCTLIHFGVMIFLLLCQRQPNAQTTLIALDHGMVYDETANLTWYPDTNSTTSTWSSARDWADELIVGGYTDWRLPSTPDGTWGYNAQNNLTKYNVTASELGHLFDISLENNGASQTNYGLQHKEPFTALISGYYWFGSTTTLSDEQTGGWIFDFAHGAQFKASLTTLAHRIAVREGNPMAAPEPATALLFLLGLPFLHSRKK